MPDESSRRVQRVEKEIREILGTYLIREFQHHADGLITISNVRVSADLKHGRVYLRVLGTTPAQGKIQQLELFDELSERHGEIQRHLGKSLGTKFCPRLEFFYDDGLDEALKVEGTLKRLADERKTLHPELAGQSSATSASHSSHDGIASSAADFDSVTDAEDE